jgi:hypothetical protein
MCEFPTHPPVFILLLILYVFYCANKSNVETLEDFQITGYLQLTVPFDTAVQKYYLEHFTPEGAIPATQEVMFTSKSVWSQ